jgi:hypothetical protein
MRMRLRPAYSREELAVICNEPHAHDYWPDHRFRVRQTISLALEMGVPPVVADLSCGDAVIGRALAPEKLILGDFAPGYEITGMIEDTISEIPHVGMFICSETIEHLDDPDAVLAKIRVAADSLVLSTPIGETDSRNEQHYWGWDIEGVEEMLTAAGWTPEYRCDAHYLSVLGNGWMPASYQLWGCR